MRILNWTLLVGLFASSAHAADYYVATSGNDLNSGSSSAPFKTLQKAVDAANPGDTVIVRKGLHRGRTTMKQSGRSGSPIVIRGEEGAVLDGGDVFTGWTPAPEIGACVYKRSLPYIPRNATWNGKYFLTIKDSRMENGTGWTYFTRPAGDSYWDGVEAQYGTLNGVTYLRFRGCQDPNREVVAFCPKQHGTITLDGASFVTIRDLTIRGGYSAIYMIREANHNIIEDNKLIGGQETVYLQGLLGKLPSSNIIRRNFITLGYIYDDFGNHWYRSERDRKIWDAFKVQAYGDARGINVLDGGPDNHIIENHIYRHFDGINHNATRTMREETIEADRAYRARFNNRIKILRNRIEHMHDSGIEAIDGGVEAEWGENVIREATLPFRIKIITVGPLYIYKNVISNVTQKSFKGSDTGDGWRSTINADPNTPGVVYFYHNTIVTGGSAISFTTVAESPSTAGAPNFWIINNVFSSSRLASTTNFPNGIQSHFNYNWAGGQYVLGNWPAAQQNVLASGQTLWSNRVNTDFQLTATSPARDRGIDLSRSWTMDGVTHPKLPGMTAAYYTDGKPDMGAIQFSGPAVTPAAPSGLSGAAASAQQINLSWTDNSNNETGFRIERKTGSGGTYAQIATVGANVRGYQNTGLSASTTYVYRVRAYNSLGNSAYTNEATVTTMESTSSGSDVAGGFTQFKTVFVPQEEKELAISYLPSSGGGCEGQIAIYNQHGQPVKILMGGAGSSSECEVKWSGTNEGGRPVASGVYTVILTQDGQTFKKKVAVVK